MTEFLRLPTRVDASTVDVDDLVERIEIGSVVLDWTDVEELDLETGRSLFDPFLDRLDAFSDALGVETQTPAIEPYVNWILGEGPEPDDPSRAWMVMQAEDSVYDDVVGRHYEYPPTIPNGRRVRPGDHVVCVRPSKESPDGRRVFAVATVGTVEDVSDDRRRAIYLDYRAIEPHLTFDEIGGDPRVNRSNSINRIPRALWDRIDESRGSTARSALPFPAGPLDGLRLDTSAGVRDAYHRIVELDLLGPAGGDHEELADDPPRTRYVVGTLAPKNDEVDPLVDDDSLDGAGEETTGGGLGEGSSEPPSRLSDSLFSSTIGLTFSVAAGVSAIRVRATWGSYDRVASEVHFTDLGNARMVWKRSPHDATLDLTLTPGRVGHRAIDLDVIDVRLDGMVRAPGPDGSVLVTLFLVNDQTVTRTELLKDRKWVFQPRLEVTAVDGESAVFVRRDHPGGGEDESGPEVAERRQLEMVYRRHAEFAIGHGIGVHAEPAGDPWVDESGWERATLVRTEVLPTYDVPVTETPGDDELAAEFPGFEGFVLAMGELATLERDELVRCLRRLPDTYLRWIESQSVRALAGEDGLDAHAFAAEKADDRARAVHARLEEGIDLIEADDVAFEAFRFANKAMRLQRLRSVYALRRRRGEEVDLADLEAGEPTEWRVFQLAFLLVNIPTIARLDHPKRTQEVGAYADLLWFPTGGGKTEAYLGVAAFAIGVRRLQGVVDGYDGDGGVTVIMRYTLRLLTLQQFQRAATLVCALEFIRETENTEEDPKWGREPFRIGLWVGNGSTPNTTAAAANWVNQEKGSAKWDAGVGSSSPLQLTNCPWCGTRLGPDDLSVEQYAGGRGRTVLHCRSRHCEFNRKHRRDEGLPVLTVDEEIYRLLPTFLLATVDKFAQMPWRGDVQALFGRVSARCDRHGWLGTEPECTGDHNKRGSLPATKRRPAPAMGLRPPDLVIQDELHLISGPLGTMVGLYETAVDRLCTWRFGDVTVRPKVIASTATTRRAADQVHRLFCRQVEIFPPSGLDASDNFFARQRRPSDEHPGRRYMGVCAPGRSRPAVLIRVYVALLAAAQWLWDNVDEANREFVDPYMTLLGYFNSLRELGGMRRLVDDDVSTRVFRVERSDRPGMAQRVMYPETSVQELTSRIRSSQIPQILDRLDVSFLADTSQDDDGRRPLRPLDAVLATNMVSVGVDVQRLGVMAVSGQPKATAEYIQATSRVGRLWPGLVVTVLNWARPRDLSHYEQFEQYHAVFYRYVEALSVTPFAPRALDRGLTGVLASLVRLDGQTYNANRGAGLVTGAGQFPGIIDAIAERAQNGTYPDGSQQEVGIAVRQAVAAKLDQWGGEASKPNRKLGYREPRQKDDVTVPLLTPPGNAPWGPFTVPVSMREVEPGVGLVLDAADDAHLPSWRFGTSPSGRDAP